jgi:hypothetical protein
MMGERSVYDRIPIIRIETISPLVSILTQR